MNEKIINILITGGAGQIAHDLLRVMPLKVDQHHSMAANIFAPDKKQFNICDPKIETKMAEWKIDWVINTAAHTHVDQAELKKQEASQVNCQGAENMAKACQRLNIPLLHLSTDYVFDGRKNKPYLEQDETHPLNTYGQTKLAGEAVIRQLLKKHLILRVSGVFGVRGNNFVKSILRLAKEKQAISVIADNQIAVTPAHSIAKAIWRMIQAIESNEANEAHEANDSFTSWGTYHYCGNVAMSWHEFAKAILSTAKELTTTVYTLNSDHIHAVSSAAFQTPAKRPTYSVLNCEKIQQIFKIEQPAWEPELRNVIRELSAT